MLRIARDFHCFDVSKLESEMTSSQFVEWMAFYQIEYEERTDTAPPLEFDNPADQDAAIDALF